MVVRIVANFGLAAEITDKGGFAGVGAGANKPVGDKA